MTTEQPDRRIHRREHIDLQVEIILGAHQWTAEVLDLSESGLSVLTPLPLSSDSDVRVVFQLPTDEVIDSEAHVAWSSQSRRAGLRFVNPTPEHLEALVNWLK